MRSQNFLARGLRHAISYTLSLLLVCGGASFAAAQETTATQAPPRDEEATKAARQNVGDTSTTVSIDPNSSVPPDEQLEFFRLGCQTFKAQQAEGQEAVDAYFQEAISAGTTMAEVLSGRGYECTDQEVRVMQRQD